MLANKTNSNLKTIANPDFAEIRSFLAFNVESILSALSAKREASKIDSMDLFGSLAEDNQSGLN